MSKLLRVISNDPANSFDAFGVIGLQATWPEKTIQIKYAKQFFRDKNEMNKLQFYKNINLQLILLKDSIQADIVTIEKNFDYDDLYKIFNSPLKPLWVQTCSSLTENNRNNVNTMDKNFMAKWLVKNLTRITIPQNADETILELIHQNMQISSYTTPSGKTGYKAKSGRHDDLFMAELIGLDVIRKWWHNEIS